MKKKTNINLFLISFLAIVLALIVSFSPFGFRPVAQAAGECNTPSTNTPNLYIYPGGGSTTGYIEPQGIKTNIGYIIDECGNNMDIPTYLTDGVKKPYQDWNWSYAPTGANLDYANLNTNGLVSCVAGQPGCSVISDVIATGYGHLVTTTRINEGWYVSCLSYLPNPQALDPKILEWDSTNYIWLDEGYSKNESITVSNYCNSRPTKIVDPSKLVN